MRDLKRLFTFFVVNPFRCYTWVATAVIGASVVMGAVQSSQSAKAVNRQSAQAQRNADRRYALQSGVAENQMEEQQEQALEKMTDVTRKFLVAKGQATVHQAESGVSGVTQKRIEAVTRGKFSEAKSKVAKETDTNVINIAQDMLAKKIDTEALIAEAEARKKNVFSETLMGAIQGGISGVGTAMAVKSAGAGKGTGTGTKSTSFTSGSN